MNSRVNEEHRVFAVSASGTVTVFDQAPPDSQEGTGLSAVTDEESFPTTGEAHA